MNFYYNPRLMHYCFSGFYVCYTFSTIPNWKTRLLYRLYNADKAKHCELLFKIL